jgi:O-antigen/teichoic acid export membrane protein
MASAAPDVTGVGRVLTGTAWLVGGTVASVAVPFLLTPVLLDALGEDGFGFYAVVVAVVGYFAVLDLGLSVSLSRNVALYAAQDDRAAVRQLVTIGVVTYVIVGLALAPVLLLLDGPIVDALDLSGPLRADAPHVLWWSYALIFVTLSTSTFRSVLMGLQRMRVIAVAEVVSQVAFAVAVVWLLAAGHGLDGVLIATYARVGVATVLLATAARRHVSPLFSLSVRRPVLTRVLSFGGWMQVNNLCSIVMLETDRILIGGFVNVAAVSRYEVANRLAMVVRLVPLQLVGALMPAATEVHAAGDEARLDRVYIQASRLLALLSLGLGGLLAGAGPGLLAVWLGRTVPDAPTILLLLVITFCLNNLTGVGTMVLRAVGNPRRETYYGVLGTGLNLVLTLALAPTFGLYGILVGTLASALVGTSYFLVTYHRMRGLPFGSTVLRPLARLLLAVVVVAGVLYLATDALPLEIFLNRLTGLPVLAGLAAAYLAALVVACRSVGFLTAEDIALARRLVARATPRTAEVRA